MALYVTSAVRRGLEQSVFIRTLRRFDGQLVVRELAIDESCEIADSKGEPLGLSVRPFATAGKLPVHFEGHAEETPEDSIGLRVSNAAGDSFAYAAACASADEGLALEGHDVVFFDGTFFDEDELVRPGLSKAHARDMAHVPLSGQSGSLKRLTSLKTRRIYTHINNTNPILAPDSDERRQVLEAGWEIAYDGMDIALGRATR